MVKILLKRIYEEPSEADGYRILLDRLWPRGLKKEDQAEPGFHSFLTRDREASGCHFPHGSEGCTT